jgi:hypothetical protein
VVELNFVEAGTKEFDPRVYIQILVTIAKADKDNGPPEFDYVRQQADRLGLDSDYYFKNTGKDFLLEKQSVSRLTALVILKDAIVLASLDGNFTLAERQKVYNYAERLDIPRSHVDRLEKLIQDFYQLDKTWKDLVAA